METLKRLRAISTVCFALAMSTAAAAPHKQLDLRKFQDAKGEYTISICSRPSPSGNIPGHIFVAYSFKPAKKERSYVAVGHTTAAGPAKALLSYKGWVAEPDGFLGEERFTHMNEQCLVLLVNEEQFNRARSSANPFYNVPGLEDVKAIGSYTLGENDCMTFAINVAKLLEGQGVKVPERKATELPMQYVRRLIESN